MSKIEAVIFDWAGTTIDYGSFAPVDAFIEAFKAFGIEPTIEEVRRPMGMLKWDHIHTMLKMPRISQAWIDEHAREFDRKDVDAIYKAFEANLFKVLRDSVVAKPYLFETVKKLRELHIKIGSTTGYTRGMMTVVIAQSKTIGYMPDAVFTANEVHGKGRPYPYMIFENMRHLDLKNVRQIIKVGDTLSDIAEGKNAGVITVGILEGSSLIGMRQADFEALNALDQEALRSQARQAYLAAGADFVIDDLSHLPVLIDQLND